MAIEPEVRQRLDRLARAKPLCAVILPAKETYALAARARNILSLVCIPLSLVLILSSSMMSHATFAVWGLPSIVAGGGMFAYTMFFLRPNAPSHEIVSWFYTISISHYQAYQLGKWIQAYPQLRSICVRWAASRSSMQLTAEDYDRVRRAVAPSRPSDPPPTCAFRWRSIRCKAPTLASPRKESSTN